MGVAMAAAATGVVAIFLCMTVAAGGFGASAEGERPMQELRPHVTYIPCVFVVRPEPVHWPPLTLNYKTPTARPFLPGAFDAQCQHANVGLAICVWRSGIATDIFVISKYGSNFVTPLIGGKRCHMSSSTTCVFVGYVIPCFWSNFFPLEQFSTGNETDLQYIELVGL